MDDRYFLIAAPILMGFIIGVTCWTMGWPIWPAFLYLAATAPLLLIIFSSKNNYSMRQKEQILEKADFDHLLCLPPEYLERLHKDKEQGRGKDNQVA